MPGWLAVFSREMHGSVTLSVHHLTVLTFAIRSFPLQFALSNSVLHPLTLSSRCLVVTSLVVTDGSPPVGFLLRRTLLAISPRPLILLTRIVGPLLVLGGHAFVMKLRLLAHRFALALHVRHALLGFGSLPLLILGQWHRE